VIDPKAKFRNPEFSGSTRRNALNRKYLTNNTPYLGNDWLQDWR